MICSVFKDCFSNFPDYAGPVGGGTAALTEDFQNLEDDETLSVAGTEYSEAPSVARSYTISHSAQVSI